MGLFGNNNSSSASSGPATPEGTKQRIIAALNEKGLKYEDVSQGGINAIKLGFTLDNYKGFQLFMFIDNDGESYQIRSGVIMNVPDDKRARILEAVNKVNHEYRWLRFYLDGDNDLVAQEDIDVFPGDDPQIFALSIMRAASIMDDVYPEFMKAQWA